MLKSAEFICGVLCFAIGGCDSIVAKRQVVELNVHHEQVLVPGATVSLVYAVPGRDCISAPSDKLRTQGHSAITDDSGLAKLRLNSNSLVGGVFPIATIQSIWRHRHPADQVTGRRFFVSVTADKDTVSGEIIAKRGNRVHLGTFDIVVIAIGRPVDAEKVGCSIAHCASDWPD